MCSKKSPKPRPKSGSGSSSLTLHHSTPPLSKKMVTSNTEPQVHFLTKPAALLCPPRSFSRGQGEKNLALSQWVPVFIYHADMKKKWKHSKSCARRQLSKASFLERQMYKMPINILRKRFCGRGGLRNVALVSFLQKFSEPFLLLKCIVNLQTRKWNKDILIEIHQYLMGIRRETI